MKTSLEVAQEFIQIVNSIYAVHLDSYAALRQFRRLLTDLESQTLQYLKTKHPHLANVEYLDNTELIYGEGEPNDPQSNPLLRSTKKEVKQRNEFPNGANYRFIGNMCVVTISQYWQEHYREEMARSLGKKKTDLVIPVLEDIKIFRNSIVHGQGRAQQKIKDCEVLKWFRKGDEIFIDNEKMKQVIRAIRDAIINEAQNRN